VVFVPPLAGGAPTSTAQSCASTKRITTSPTGSRLVAVHRGRFVAYPGAINPDGSISDKAPWLAYGPSSQPAAGPRGALRIVGSRVPPSPLRLRVTTTRIWQEGFQGSAMWAVVLIFPEEGCWRITGRAERTTLTFRVLVTQ
jgi:hypothetical protein